MIFISENISVNDESNINSMFLNVVCFASIFIISSNLAFASADTITLKNTGAKNRVQVADRYFSEQNYAAAFNLYSAALKEDNTNPNLKFKTALANIYLLQHPAKSVALLRDAIANSKIKYSFYKKEEVPASIDAYYYMGKAMMYSGKIDSAIQYFVQYQGKAQGDLPLDVNRQLQMCLNAKQLMQIPRDLNVSVLGGAINTEYNETNPVISPDGKTLFFASRKLISKQSEVAFFDDNIYYSSIDANGKWTTPIAFLHNSVFDEEPLSFSPDGKYLYLRRTNRKGRGDIFMSENTNGQWSLPVKVKGINSSADENGLSISNDGSIAILSSNRVGGNGGYDLYIAKIKNSKFFKAKNIGKAVNTEMDEISPFVLENSNRIYFATNGNTEYGMGGYDIFFTEKDSSKKMKWSKPFTMGYPLNRSDNEFGYVKNNDKMLFTAVGANGSLDIYEIKEGKFDRKITDVLADTENGVETIETFEIESSDQVEVMDLTELEKEKEEKEVEVTTVEEVEKEIEKNVGFVDEKDAKNLDNVTAVKTEEIEVMNILEADSAEDKKENFSKEEVLGSMEKKEREDFIHKLKEDLLVEINQKRSTIFKTIYFDFNSTEIKLETYELKLLVDFLKENKNVNIEVVGHTDNLGAWETNFWVSRERAKSVFDYLVKNKISPSRMIFNGKGAIMPVASNSTSVGRTQNRRVEIILIQ